MTELLADPDPDVRRAVILALGKIGRDHPEVQASLLRFAQDPDPNTRLNAVVALAGLGVSDDSVIPNLVEALGSQDKALAKSAAHSLGEVAVDKPDKVLAPMMEVLKTGDQARLRLAVTVLRRMKDKAVPALPLMVDIWARIDPKDRMDLIEALSMIDVSGVYAVPAMVKALDEPDPRDRKEALLGLMRYRDKVETVLDPLAKATRDKDLSNRLLAIGIIRGLGPKAINALSDLMSLTTDPDPQIRRSAMGAIAIMKPSTEDVLPLLERTITDSDISVRLATASTMQHLGTVFPDRVMPLLKKALDGEKNERVKTVINEAIRNLTSGPSKQSAASARGNSVTKKQ